MAVNKAAMVNGFEVGAGKEEMGVGAGEETEGGSLGLKGVECSKSFMKTLLLTEAAEKVIDLLLDLEMREK